MRISSQKIKTLCAKRSLRLKDLLKKSKVSPTAYYSLIRKDEILPNSIKHLAKTLGVLPSAFLEEMSPAEKKIHQRRKKVREILKQESNLDPENIWHTLALLDKKPIERLERSILRAQKFNFYQRRSSLSTGTR